jgi:hypothetical protein
MAPIYRRRGALVGAAGVAVAGALVLAGRNHDSVTYLEATAATRRQAIGGNLPSSGTRRALVGIAILAANSHNTQPWLFRLTERSIAVLPDRQRRLPAVDPDDRHLYVSLGCAAENIVQAADAFGLRAIPRFDSNAGGIAVDLDPAPRMRPLLFDAIAQRQSTRAVYDGRPVPAEAYRVLEAAGQGPGVRMLLFAEPKQREDILEFLVAANTAQMADPAFVKELKSWIRFSYDDALATGDGLFAKTAGNPAVPGWIGRTMFPLLFTTASENRKYQLQVRSSAGIAVFVSDKNEPASWVEVGRCCQRFALRATALGLRLAFIDQPVEVVAIRAQFATWLGVGARRPDIVMRFGNGPEMPRSLRRPIEQVIAGSDV